VDLTWVLPSLAVGARLRPSWLGHLARDLGVRRVVDLRAEAQDDEGLLRRYGIELLHLPATDLRAIPRDALWTGVTWVRRQLARGERVLLHCEHGIGRSVLLACCVLVSRGRSPAEALELVKRARWKASPSPEQLEALLVWSDEWCRVTGERRPHVTWDDLARIAYRHLKVRSEGP
jgi:hypothetical protein